MRISKSVYSKDMDRTFITLRADSNTQDWLILCLDGEYEWEIKGTNLNIKPVRR